MDDQEKGFQKILKLKMILNKLQLSKQKLQHPANIRVKTLEKKKEMKQITEKANKLKQLESFLHTRSMDHDQFFLRDLHDHGRLFVEN